MMALSMLAILTIPAFASAASIGKSDGDIVYTGEVEIPVYNVTFYQYGQGDGGYMLLLNPYSVEAQSDGSITWAPTDNKTAPVITRPVWIQNECNCNIQVALKNVKAEVGSDDVLVATSPIKKPGEDKEVFLYMDAENLGERVGGADPQLPDENTITFAEYTKASNQLAVTDELNEEIVPVLKLAPPSTAGKATWGAVKICGEVSIPTDTDNLWEEDDTVNIQYILDISFCGPDTTT